MGAFSKFLPVVSVLALGLGGCTQSGGNNVAAVGGSPTPPALGGSSLSAPPNSGQDSASGVNWSGVQRASSSGSPTGGARVVPVNNTLPAPSGQTAAFAEYRINAMDTLEVSVYQVDDLRRTVTVDQSGRINLPLIGDVSAGGSTVAQLEGRIEALLGDKYLQSPQVTVVVKDAPGRRITVDGSVRKPGIYPINGKTTLLQAIALSAGLDDIAKETEVTVFRSVNNQQRSAMFDIKAIRKGSAPDPEVYAGDVIVVGKSGFKSTVRDIAPAFGIFSRAVTMVP